MARRFRNPAIDPALREVHLGRLFPDAARIGCRDLSVAACNDEARHLQPGELFIALPDASDELEARVRLACERGAVGILAEQPLGIDNLSQWIVPDARKALGLLAHALHGQPAESLQVNAFVGSLGRASAAQWARLLLDDRGHRVGWISGENWSDGVRTFHRGSGPVRPRSLAAMLAAMVDQGARHVVIDIDPGMLERRSLEGVSIDRLVILADPPGATVSDDRRHQYARLARSIRPSGTIVLDASAADTPVLAAVNLDSRALLVQPTGAGVEIVDLDRTRTMRRIPLRSTDPVQRRALAATLGWAVGSGVSAREVETLATFLPNPASRFVVDDESHTFRLIRDPGRNLSDIAEVLLAARDSNSRRIQAVIECPGEPTQAATFLADVGGPSFQRIVLCPTNAFWADNIAVGRQPVALGEVTFLCASRKAALAFASEGLNSSDTLVLVGPSHASADTTRGRVEVFDDADLLRAASSRSASWRRSA